MVLDEADKLFELGKESTTSTPAAASAEDAATDKSFLGQVDEILAACSHPKVRTRVCKCKRRFVWVIIQDKEGRMT